MTSGCPTQARCGVSGLGRARYAQRGMHGRAELLARAHQLARPVSSAVVLRRAPGSVFQSAVCQSNAKCKARARSGAPDGPAPELTQVCLDHYALKAFDQAKDLRQDSCHMRANKESFNRGIRWMIWCTVTT